MARTPASRGSEHPVPDDALRWMAAGSQLEYEGALLGREPRRIVLSVDSEEREWDLDDPHRDDEGGSYRVPADALVAHSDHYDPDGVLVWLPYEACFGAWDPDHWDVVTFPGATWADIVVDPGRYLDALEDGNPDSMPYLVPLYTHPFVDEDGKVYAPLSPPKPTKPTPIGDAERAFAAAASALLGEPAPEDPSDVAATLLAHGRANEEVRADVLAALCAYVRQARPVPPPEVKRRPRPSPGVTSTMKIIGQCNGWGPIDLHGTHLHDLRFTGRGRDDLFVVAGDLDLHGCLLTGRTRWMWTKILGSARLSEVVADGDFDIGNAFFAGPVTYARSRLNGRQNSLGREHAADVDASGIECLGAASLGGSYAADVTFDGALFQCGIQSMGWVGGAFSMRDARLPCEGERIGDSWMAHLWARFDGPVDLSGSTIRDFGLSGRFARSVDLTDVTATGHQVKLAGTFEGPVTMRGMRSEGPVAVDTATFAEPPDLTDGPEIV